MLVAKITFLICQQNLYASLDSLEYKHHLLKYSAKFVHSLRNPPSSLDIDYLVSGTTAPDWCIWFQGEIVSMELYIGIYYVTSMYNNRDNIITHGLHIITITRGAISNLYWLCYTYCYTSELNMEWILIDVISYVSYDKNIGSC